VSLLPASPTEGDAVQRWNDALDELDEWIDRALRSGQDDDGSDDPLEADASGAWAAPEDLGPLPRHLVARATDVLSRLDAAERELSARRDATQAELAERRQRPPTAFKPSGPDAAYVDRIA
jgi:hypothetical protein